MFDAALQAQPQLFTAAWWRDDLAQSVMGLPLALNAAIFWVVRIIAAEPVVWNALFVTVETAMGLALITGRGERVAIAASVPWALGVWFVGEGLGTLPAGFGLLASGAPGPVLYYPLLGLLAWPGRKRFPMLASREHLRRKAATAWSAVWVGGALLELVSPFPPARVIEANLEEASLGEPRLLVRACRFVYEAVAAHPMMIPVVLACVEVVVGIGVVSGRYPRLGLGVGIGITLVFWVVPQCLGTVFAGGATDPGAAPLVILLALAAWPGVVEREWVLAAVVP